MAQRERAMAKRFIRSLPKDGLNRLRTLSEPGASNWWAHLLSHWCPAGSESGQSGLRLAIRNGYLNFYRRGQSVAKVSFTPTGVPACSLHSKYVWPEDTGDYVVLDDAGVRGRPDVRYSEDALLSWIQNADQKSDDEKRFVDRLVANNPNAIDVEMGLPGLAKRIDLVTLYKSEGEPHVAFWEVKLRRNGELKSRSATPKVLSQLANYREFLSSPSRHEEIREATTEACWLLRELHRMAARRTTMPPLGPLIESIAESRTSATPDDYARLAIYDDASPKSDDQAWNVQLENLRRNNVIPLLLDGPAAL